eukprot:scaffold71578_cov55-Cyclotella_meneghiniana.AAC.1
MRFLLAIDIDFQQLTYGQTEGQPSCCPATNSVHTTPTYAFGDGDNDAAFSAKRRSDFVWPGSVTDKSNKRQRKLD